MNSMSDAVVGLFKAFENPKMFVKPGDYQENELWHCGKCRTPKQHRVEFQGTVYTPFCECLCGKEHDEALRRQREQDKIERRRQICFPDYETSLWRFESDNGLGDVHAMQVARNYAQNFEVMSQQKHLGLLFYGDTGVGKSFAAACIANFLIDNGYSCYMSDFTQIEGMLWDADSKQQVYNEIAAYDLLVIDDLGKERDSEYVSEIVMNVIEMRCRNGKPVIVTTNLTPNDLTNPQENNSRKLIRKKRVYSRLYKMTIPVKYNGIDRRLSIMEKNHADVKELLGL